MYERLVDFKLVSVHSWRPFVLAHSQVVDNSDPESRRRVAQYFANFEPFTLLSALADVTERIRLTSTASMTCNVPSPRQMVRSCLV